MEPEDEVGSTGNFTEALYLLLDPGSLLHRVMGQKANACSSAYYSYRNRGGWFGCVPGRYPILGSRLVRPAKAKNRVNRWVPFFFGLVIAGDLRKKLAGSLDQCSK